MDGITGCTQPWNIPGGRPMLEETHGGKSGALRKVPVDDEDPRIPPAFAHLGGDLRIRRAFRQHGRAAKDDPRMEEAPCASPASSERPAEPGALTKAAAAFRRTSALSGGAKRRTDQRVVLRPPHSFSFSSSSSSSTCPCPAFRGRGPFASLTEDEDDYVRTCPHSCIETVVAGQRSGNPTEFGQTPPLYGGLMPFNPPPGRTRAVQRSRPFSPLLPSTSAPRRMPEHGGRTPSGTILYLQEAASISHSRHSPSIRISDSLSGLFLREAVPTAPLWGGAERRAQQRLVLRESSLGTRTVRRLRVALRSG
jgi:hypothetical protein